MLELRLSVYEGADSLQWYVYLGDLPFHEQSRVSLELTCDLSELLRSCSSEGDFLMFVCLCGFPSCQGYYVEVKHSEQEVFWKRVYAADSGSIGGKIGSVDWVFDRIAYLNTIKKALDISEMVAPVIIRKRAWNAPPDGNLPVD